MRELIGRLLYNASSSQQTRLSSTYIIINPLKPHLASRNHLILFIHVVPCSSIAFCSNVCLTFFPFRLSIATSSHTPALATRKEHTERKPSPTIARHSYIQHTHLFTFAHRPVVPKIPRLSEISFSVLHRHSLKTLPPKSKRYNNTQTHFHFPMIPSKPFPSRVHLPTHFSFHSGSGLVSRVTSSRNDKTHHSTS